MGEVILTAYLCWFLSGGATEVRHEFPNLGQDRAVRVDGQTNDHVIEVALDGKPSARDGVNQAVFASILTGRIPLVIVIDRDGKVDRYQYEVQEVASYLGIAYGTCSEEKLVRWMERAGWNGPTPEQLADCEMFEQVCDLGDAFRLPQIN